MQPRSIERPRRSHHFSPRPDLAVISQGVHEGRPVTRVIYGEGGFTLLDAEMADENPDDHELEEFHAVCLDCLIERHPEAGVDLARRGILCFVEGHGWMEEMA